jgi:hypothetical protein
MKKGSKSYAARMGSRIALAQRLLARMANEPERKRSMSYGTRSNKTAAARAASRPAAWPRPHAIDSTYRGSDKLRDKVALISDGEIING